jgi:hypothetical protein
VFLPLLFLFGKKGELDTALPTAKKEDCADVVLLEGFGEFDCKNEEADDLALCIALLSCGLANLWPLRWINVSMSGTLFPPTILNVLKALDRADGPPEGGALWGLPDTGTNRKVAANVVEVIRVPNANAACLLNGRETVTNFPLRLI